MEKVMKEEFISGKNYRVKLEYDEHSLCVAGGSFGEISLAENHLFEIRLKNVNDGACKKITSRNAWSKLDVLEYDKGLKLTFSEPDEIKNIAILLNAEYSEAGVLWQTEVINKNPEYSVMDITYPTPKTASDKFSLFLPDGCGIVVADAQDKSYRFNCRYPGGVAVMQYFAIYGKNDGIYIGIEDGKGCVKEFDVKTQNGEANVNATFFGINSSVGANSFSVSTSSSVNITVGG